MLCHVSLSSVLEARASHHVIQPILGAVNGSRRFHASSPAPDDRPRIKFVESETTGKNGYVRKVAALRRLNKNIDPNDLSATLEAHRESNTTSVIRQVRSVRSDPSTIRPSFLNERAEPKWIRDGVRQSTRDEKPQKTDQTITTLAQSEHSRVLPTVHGQADQSNEQDTLELHDMKMGHPAEEQRRACLRKFEEPLLPLSPDRSRPVYFDSIRRLKKVIQRKQNKLKTAAGLRDISRGILEYSGRRIPLKALGKDPRSPEPWTVRLPEDASSAEELEAEIDAFANWMEQTPTEAAARAAVYDDIFRLISATNPNLLVEKFGSQATGLIMPMSDLDLRIYPKNFDLHFQRNPKLYTDDAKAFLSSMHELLEVIRAHPDFTLGTFVWGRFPLIGVTHLATGLRVQLVATPDTSRSREYMKTYLSEYPTLRPLFMVVKTVFDMRGLSDVWYGGVGSYAVFMMVVASLKLKSKASDSISKQLLDFLEFYESVNTYRHGVGIEPPRLYQKGSMPKPEDVEAAKGNLSLQGQHHIARPAFYQRYLLSLQDPADPFNDLGRKSFAIKDIQATLRFMKEHLLINNVDGGRGSGRGAEAGQGGGVGQGGGIGHVRPSRDQPLLRRLVGRCDQLYDESRTKLDLFGEDVLLAQEVEAEEREKEGRVQ